MATVAALTVVPQAREQSAEEAAGRGAAAEAALHEAQGAAAEAARSFAQQLGALQAPAAHGAATVCLPDCNHMYPRLQPYASQARLSLAEAAGGTAQACAAEAAAGAAKAQAAALEKQARHSEAALASISLELARLQALL